MVKLTYNLTQFEIFFFFFFWMWVHFYKLSNEGMFWGILKKNKTIQE